MHKARIEARKELKRKDEIIEKAVNLLNEIRQDAENLKETKYCLIYVDLRPLLNYSAKETSGIFKR